MCDCNLRFQWKLIKVHVLWWVFWGLCGDDGHQINSEYNITYGVVVPRILIVTQIPSYYRENYSCEIPMRMRLEFRNGSSGFVLCVQIAKFSEEIWQKNDYGVRNSIQKFRDSRKIVNPEFQPFLKECLLKSYARFQMLFDN